jgi:preprotein translocase subunit SecG
MPFLYFTLVTLFLIVCVFLILLVLIQKGRGGGLASAFGGGGGHTAFGSKTGDVLTWATSIVFGVFVLLAVALNLVANNIGAAPKKPAVQTSIPAGGGGTSSGSSQSGGDTGGSGSDQPANK